MRSSNKVHVKLTETAFDQNFFCSFPKQKRISIQSSVNADEYSKQIIKTDQYTKQKVKAEQYTMQKQRTIHIFVQGKLFAPIFCTIDDKASPESIYTQLYSMWQLFPTSCTLVGTLIDIV